MAARKASPAVCRLPSTTRFAPSSRATRRMSFRRVAYGAESARDTTTTPGTLARLAIRVSAMPIPRNALRSSTPMVSSGRMATTGGGWAGCGSGDGPPAHFQPAQAIKVNNSAEARTGSSQRRAGAAALGRVATTGPVAVPVRAARRRLASSPAEPGRRPGSRLRLSATTSATVAGTEGWMASARGASSRRARSPISSALRPWCGGRPVSISKSTAAAA